MRRIALEGRAHEARQARVWLFDPFGFTRSHDIQLRPFQIWRRLTPALGTAPLERRVRHPCSHSGFGWIGKAAELHAVPVDSSDSSSSIDELSSTWWPQRRVSSDL